MIYIHIPFCHRRCYYCGFYSTTNSSRKEEYVDALCKEIERRADGHKVKTVYFGGGTPSKLTIKQIEKIINALRSNYDLSQAEEITIEANPEDLTAEYMSGIKSLAFFNRLSIGVQSFNERELRSVGRVHSATEAIEAIERAHSEGIHNISIDLIYGLPGQKSASWKESLEHVSKLTQKGMIQHLSCYEITIEPGSVLERQIALGRATRPAESLVEEAYSELIDWCSGNGFLQYEISNFAQSGYFSRHNSRYWDGTPYQGYGAAAHSFDGNKRRWNIADIEQYIKGIREDTDYYETEQLTERDKYNELIMTSLRTVTGIKKRNIPPLYRDELAKKIAPYIKRGIIEETEESYCPTARGLLLADGVACELFADE